MDLAYSWKLTGNSGKLKSVHVRSYMRPSIRALICFLKVVHSCSFLFSLVISDS